jgi:hypothetical protein
MNQHCFGLRFEFSFTLRATTHLKTSNVITVFSNIDENISGIVIVRPKRFSRQLHLFNTSKLKLFGSEIVAATSKRGRKPSQVDDCEKKY